MTRQEIADLVLSFPDAAESTSYGEPSFKVAGRFFTWLRPKLDDSLVVHCDSFDERELLIEMDPATFHFTEHYRNDPIVLARIVTVDRAWLAAVLARRWRRIAPKRLQARHPRLPGEPQGA